MGEEVKDGGIWHYFGQHPDANAKFNDTGSAPLSHGILFDQPHVVEQATCIASQQLESCGGNFFEDARCWSSQS